MRRVARYIASISRNATVMQQLQIWRTEQEQAKGPSCLIEVPAVKSRHGLSIYFSNDMYEKKWRQGREITEQE